MVTPLRILLVEDDPVDAALLRHCATQSRAVEQVVVSRVDRLSEALERLVAAAATVDVVLLDLGLPDSQGLETLTRLQEVSSDVPVVVLTGSVDDEVARAAVEAGAQDFIGKEQLPHLQLARVTRHAVERHRLRAELEASELRFRTLVELADDALIWMQVHPQLRVEYAGPALEKITGLTADQLGRDMGAFTDRVHPEDRSAWSDVSRLERGAADRLVYRWQRPDGCWVWLEDRRTPVLQDGRLVAVQAILRDLTPIKHAELQLERALQQERAAVEKLRSLDELKSTFLQAVSHELRTPLTAIQGFALTLESHDERLPGDQRAAILGRLAAASQRLRQLLEDLLDVDRLNRGLIRAERRPTDVGRLVRMVVDEVEGHGHPVSMACDGEVEAALDAPKVERIVENLVANAVKHTPAGTPIHVTARVDHDRVQITVADHGPGIAAEDAARLFEPFVQGEVARGQPSPGTGIGLSLVSRFAQLHGGHVRIESTPGHGATFVVELPTADDAGRGPAPQTTHSVRDIGTTPAPEAIVTDGLRRVLRATAVDEISEILVQTVVRLGGASRSGLLEAPEVLPLDLSLGAGPPLVPVAPVGSAARDLLQSHMPMLLEDARVAAQTIQRLEFRPSHG